MRQPAKLFFLILSFFLSSCTQNHFYVQQEKRDRTFLASSRVHTPDPRQYHPPEGDALLIYWDFPLNLLEKELELVAKVRLYNGKEEIVIRPILRAIDHYSIFFPGQKILTYLVQGVSSKGEVVGEWEHQFWTKWIDLDDIPKQSLDQKRSECVPVLAK